MTRATSSLGDAIGVGAVSRDVPSSTALGEHVADFSQAVATYCRVLVGRVNEKVPASVERFRRAVAPIDEYRTARAQRGGDDTDETTQVSPALEVAPGMPGSSPFMPVTPA